MAEGSARGPREGSPAPRGAPRQGGRCEPSGRQRQAGGGDGGGDRERSGGEGGDRKGKVSPHLPPSPSARRLDV